MASPDDVMGALVNPNDAITVYDGAGHQWFSWAQLANGGWKAWDLRGWVRQLTWDLLRFQPIDYGKPNPDRTVPYGLRDAITRTMYQADQCEQKLDLIIAAMKIDTSSITAAKKHTAFQAPHQGLHVVS
jgi:hypothetical protein